VPRPMLGRDLLHPLHPDRVVHMAEYIDMLWKRGDGGSVASRHQSAMPSCQRMKANSSAVSCRLSKRPDLPPWPAPILVLRMRMLPSVLVARSFATHFAGSQ